MKSRMIQWNPVKQIWRRQRRCIMIEEKNWIMESSDLAEIMQTSDDS